MYAVPMHRHDINEFIANPNLSPEALKGFIIEYENIRLRMENDIKGLKQEEFKLRHNLREIVIDNKRLMEENDEYAKEQKKEKELIKILKSQISLIEQEKNATLEILKLNEIDEKRADEMLLMQNTQKLEIMKTEMENLKRDYSAAIKLLEGKLSQVELELKNSKIDNDKLSMEIVKLKEFGLKKDLEYDTIDKKLLESNDVNKNLSKTIEKNFKNIEEMKLGENKIRLQLKKIIEASDKSTKREKLMQEDQLRLQQQFSNYIKESNAKFEKEKKNIQMVSSKKLKNLIFQLEDAIKEKDKIMNEFNTYKVDWSNKTKDVIENNKDLQNRLQECINRYQLEKSQWFDERTSLRQQLIMLKHKFEKFQFAMREESQFIPCESCGEFKKFAERYKALARRYIVRRLTALVRKWEETAMDFSEQFENSLEISES